MQRMSKHLHTFPQAMLAIYMVLLAAAVCMLVELLVFHVVLISKDMTTYDFIIAQREQLAAGVPGAPIAGTSTAASLRRLFLHLLKCGPCCASTKVQPEALASLPPAKKVHVSLNPCTACHTHKLEGSPQTWVQQGKLTVTATRQGNNKPSIPSHNWPRKTTARSDADLASATTVVTPP